MGVKNPVWKGLGCLSSRLGLRFCSHLDCSGLNVNSLPVKVSSSIAREEKIRKDKETPLYCFGGQSRYCP